MENRAYRDWFDYVKSLVFKKDNGLKILITNWHGFNVWIADIDKTLLEAKFNTPEEAVRSAQQYLNQSVPPLKYKYCAIINVCNMLYTQCELWGDFPAQG